MNIERDVTVVMPTFNDCEFATASIWAIRRFYPGIRIIIAHGGWGNADKYYNLVGKVGDFVQAPGVKAEITSNLGASLVESAYLLFMSPDVKVVAPEAVSLLVETLEETSAAETGAYGVKVTSWENFEGFVGTEFTAHMDLDACSGYFQMHRTSIFRMVGGFRFCFFYPVTDFDPREECDADLEITNRYKLAGYKCVSPKNTIPVIHWGGGSRYNRKTAFGEWHEKNVKHTHCNSLNAWFEEWKRE